MTKNRTSSLLKFGAGVVGVEGACAVVVVVMEGRDQSDPRGNQTAGAYAIGRCCLRCGACSTAWRFHAIDATLRPKLYLLT